MSTASCFPTGQWYEGGQLTSKVSRNISEANHKKLAPVHQHDALLCPDCGSVFTGKRKLWYHIKTEHVGKRFECPQCQCTFASRGGLSDHVRHIHEKLARYQCETCGKGYSIRSNYLDHLATHTGFKRNVCALCQKQFTFKYSLKVHIRKCHANDVTHI